jgi:hypothetical protein
VTEQPHTQKAGAPGRDPWELLEALRKLHGEFCSITTRFVQVKDWDRAAEAAEQAAQTRESILRCVALLGLTVPRGSAS